jgi:hypothetical protein
MSDWNFIDKFGKEVAKRAGISKDEAWKATPGGRLPDGSEGCGYKYRFDEEAMHGFSKKLKDWILTHPNEVAKLIACIAAGPTTIAIAPAVVAMLGFGPLGPIAGELHFPEAFLSSL